MIPPLQSRNPSVEILESRITPAGNVLAQVVGGHLIVTGDGEANALEISETLGGSEEAVAYLLTPLDGSTSINGSSESLTITGVRGDVRFVLKGGNDILQIPQTVEFRVVRDLRIDGGAGDNTIKIGGGVIRGSIVITNGAGYDVVEALDGFVTEGNVSISNGPGSSTTRVGGGFGTGNLSISNGAGAEFIAEISAATINGSLIIQAPKAEVARISVGAPEIQNGENSQVFRNLRIITGTGSDEIALTNVGHMDTGTISTGSGSDFVVIDDVDFRKDFTLSTGAGGDVVKIETREGSGLSTLFDGRVRADLGAGDDVLRLGVAGSVVSRVEVFLANHWNGGSGDDRLDAGNVFTFGSEPKFFGFEHYGAPPLFRQPAFFDFGSYDAGTYPTNLDSADLNGDGNLDLVAVDNELGTLNILFGNGDGTFAQEVVIEAGARPGGLAVADVDGKNGLDLVLASQGERLVGVFLNDGAGNFGARSTFSVGRDIPPIGVIVADYNGDAKPDVAALNLSGYQDGSVSILLGAGDGSFTFLQEYTLTGPDIDYFGAPNDIAVGDVDGDSNLDLAATGLRGFGVLLGNGDGTFRVRVEQRAVASGLELADMNGDGKLDLLMQVNHLELQLGNGDGTFGEPIVLSEVVTGEPYTADFNNDGILDIAATRFEFYGDLLEVLLGRGDGTFEPPLDFEIGNESGPIAIGDLNRDGFRDVAVANAYAARIAVLLNRGRA